MKYFSTLAFTVLLTSVLPAKQVFGKITLPLGKVEVSLYEGTWERAKPFRGSMWWISTGPYAWRKKDLMRVRTLRAS